MLVQRKKEVQRAELREAHGWRNSLEVSHFQWHCKNCLSYLPPHHAKSIPVTFLWALAFGSFPRMQHLPRCFPKEHWIPFLQQNNLCSVPSSRSWQLGTGHTAGSITRYGWPQGARASPKSTWHPTGEDSSNEQQLAGPSGVEFTPGLMQQLYPINLADQVVMALQFICTEQTLVTALCSTPECNSQHVWRETWRV